MMKMLRGLLDTSGLGMVTADLSGDGSLRYIRGPWGQSPFCLRGPLAQLRVGREQEQPGKRREEGAKLEDLDSWTAFLCTTKLVLVIIISKLIMIVIRLLLKLNCY